MSYLPANSSSQSQSPSLAAWLQDNLSYPGTQMRCRIRGNILNILYEGDPTPDQQAITYHVLQKLNTTDLNALDGHHLEDLTSDEHPSSDQSAHIYQVCLYGRSPHLQKNAWTFRINLDQLGHYIHHFTVRPVSSTPSSTPNGLLSAPATDPATSIARQLSETLNHLGVSVAVRIKTRSPSSKPTSESPPTISFPTVRDSDTQRLLVFCKASYSPSPSLIAEPVARQLRSLNLEGFKDAILSVKVQGEEKPEWFLRIDLTPPDALLQEWAQWGDVEAIHHLANQALEPVGARVLNAYQKDTTLHLVCQPGAVNDSPEPSSPQEQVDSQEPSNLPSDLLSDERLAAPVISRGQETPVGHDDDGKPPLNFQEAITGILQSLLDSLSPQGIQSAVVDGQQDDDEAPLWVQHLDLATSAQPARGMTPLTLALQGNLEAIAFLLSRLLNPDLMTQIETGGIRIQLLQKQGLLHVMCSAIVCPDKFEVVPKIVGFLKEIQHPNMAGVRIYGRRSGVRAPLWSQGEDFVVRSPLVPKPAAEYSVSDAYVKDLIGTPTDESPLRDDLTSEELLARWSRFRHQAVHRVRRSLLRTQLVALTPDSPTLAIPSTIQKHGLKTAAVWAAVGVLAVIQVDWFLGAIGQYASQQLETHDQSPSPLIATQPEASPDTAPFASPNDGTTNGAMNGADDGNLATNNAPTTVDDSVSVVSELTSPDIHAAGSSLLSVVPGSAADTLSAMQSELLSQSPYPTFNSNQLDLKLAMYYQHVAEFGPPDVLVIGSSRALRGIDPVVLEKALTDLGYDNADVFNFGINGATAQVVELVVHRILDPAQLPKLILWADGARAFNGGREDRTYQGIAASEGYQLLSEGALSVPVVNDGESQMPTQPAQSERNWVRAFSQTLTRSYGDLDDWLSDRLATVSTAHQRRDAIKSVIQDGFTGDLSREVFAFGSDSPDDNQPGQLPSSSSDEVAFKDADTLARVPGQIGIDGFLPLDARFDPVTYYETYARVPGNYDQDYANFQLSGQQTQALETLLQLGDTHDVPIVFINLPLTEEYLDPYRLEHEQAFRQHLLSFDLTHDQFIFRDLSELWLTESENDSPAYYQYFSDPSHLNQYGAVELSERIAQDPMIPWLGSEF